MKLVDMQVTGYLDILASDAPAPGGGSAAALCGAQGIGLVAMVAGQTAIKKAYEADWPLCHEIADEGKKLFEALTAQVDKDTDAYNIIAAAFKMPKETEEQKAVRRQEIARGTLISTEVPFEPLNLAVRALELAERLLGHYNTNCASDLGVGGLNLHTCVHGAWMNVLINLGGIKDEEKKNYFETEGKKLVARADELAAKVNKTVMKDIIG